MDNGGALGGTLLALPHWLCIGVSEVIRVAVPGGWFARTILACVATTC